MASAAKTVWDRIIQGVKNNTNLFDRMDDDLDLYDLVQWQPEDDEPIDIEDAYTTNAPKVLADKIISFISQTNLVFRIDSDKAGNQQEKVNDNTEELAIGMLANVDRRRRRMGEPTIIKTFPRKVHMLVTLHLHSTNLFIIEINEDPKYRVQRFRDGWRWSREPPGDPQEYGQFNTFNEARDSVWIEMSAALIAMNDIPISTTSEYG